MKKLRRARFASALFCIATPLAYTSATHADVVISDKPTQNMSCDAGVCTATAPKAVLNVTDLTNMLASADTKVETGSLAKDIAVKAALSWTSASRLTLDAQHSVEVAKPVAVTGAGALTIATNDGGQNGEFLIDPKASVQFWTLTSSLIIDGNSYTLVGDIKTLAADIAANPSGFYALAKPYDASADGTYSSHPIGDVFDGVLEGLGNKILSLSINSEIQGDLVGLFNWIGSDARVRDLGLAKASPSGRSANGFGILAGVNYGQIARCWVDGVITFPVTAVAGGLVGTNEGSVVNSYSEVKIEGAGALEHVGGLIGFNDNGAKVSSAYALHSIAMKNATSIDVGGLVGETKGLVADSFARNRVIVQKRTNTSNFGGLVGKNDPAATIESSYAAGPLTMRGEHQGLSLGGVIGFDAAQAGHIADAYWDLDEGISDPNQGAGNVKNDPGITGLTTEQFLSGLPQGFDPKIWAQNANFNGGFPYLRAVPPK